MNKRFLGIKIGTIVTVAICFILAVFMWLFVNFQSTYPMNSGIMLLDLFRGLI